MKSWSIRNRIVASFGLLLALMLAMGCFAHVRLSEIEAETDLADRDSIAGLYVSSSLREMWGEESLLTLKYLDEANPEARKQLLKVRRFCKPADKSIRPGWTNTRGRSSPPRTANCSRPSRRLTPAFKNWKASC